METRNKLKVFTSGKCNAQPVDVQQTLGMHDGPV